MDSETIKKPFRLQLRDALWLAVMQYLSWGICTISWRAVAQANILASVITDSTLATLQFFVFRRIAKDTNSDVLVPWIGYMVGGVLGTISGIYLSIWILGK